MTIQRIMRFGASTYRKRTSNLLSGSLSSGNIPSVTVSKHEICKINKDRIAPSRRYSSQSAPTTAKVTLPDLKKKYTNNIPISMVTAYDYSSAYNVDKAGIDMILVGDSLAMVMLGHPNTTSVTVDEMIHHCKAVHRGAQSAFIVGDMPFGSYEISPVDAVKNAIRLVKEGHVEAVKMEGGVRIKESVKAVIAAGIPVIGHIGLTPQTATAVGGFKVQGKTASAAKLLLEDALELQRCGVSMIVLESVPEVLGTYITKQLKIPTIGIGAGNGCNGQVLVYHDMLGLYPHFTPKFCKQYSSLADTIQQSLTSFKTEVETRAFPTIQHSYTMKIEEFSKAFPDALIETTTPSSTTISKTTTPITSTTTTTIHNNKSNEIPLNNRKNPMTTTNNNNIPINNETTTTTTDPIMNGGPYIQSKNRKPTIAIIGGGAMGSLLSGRLAATGECDVWMVTSWQDHIRKINQTGLTLRNMDHSTQSIPFQATSEVEEIISARGGADIAVILVKSPQTQQAAKAAATVVRPRNGIVLTLQNGLGNRDQILEILGKQDSDASLRVIQGVTSQASSLLNSGLVWHTGEGPTALALPSSYDTNSIGKNPLLSKGNSNPLLSEATIATPENVAARVVAFAELMTRAGLPCSLTEAEGAEGLVWSKLIINAGINPLTALLRVRNGVLAQSSACRNLMQSVVEEAVAVGKAQGVALPAAFRDPEIAFASVLKVAKATSENVSSMLADVTRGVPTEIHEMNGAIVRAGEPKGIAVPRNKRLCELLDSPVVPHCTPSSLPLSM